MSDFPAQRARAARPERGAGRAGGAARGVPPPRPRAPPGPPGPFCAGGGAKDSPKLSGSGRFYQAASGFTSSSAMAALAQPGSLVGQGVGLLVDGCAVCRNGVWGRVSGCFEGAVLPAWGSQTCFHTVSTGVSGVRIRPMERDGTLRSSETRPHSPFSHTGGRTTCTCRLGCVRIYVHLARQGRKIGPVACRVHVNPNQGQPRSVVTARGPTRARRRRRSRPRSTSRRRSRSPLRGSSSRTRHSLLGSPRTALGSRLGAPR